MKILGFVLAVLLSLSYPVGASDTKPDFVEILELRGEINSGSVLTGDVEKINSNPRAKAVVLVIDSPGGGVLATKTLYDTLAKLKAPVVAWCDNVCASGGLYVAMSPSVKKIVVRDITITGSIGVLMTGFSVNRLLDWAKVDPYVFKSGPLKDSGNETRALTDADKTYLQDIIDYLAGQFYGIVGKARPAISKEDFDKLKTARIVFGAEAVAMGLADVVGDRDAAVEAAKKLSGSKSIFTREELRKLSKDASEGGPSSAYGYKSPPVEPEARLVDNLNWLVEQLRSLRRGDLGSFEYRLPWRF